MARECLTCTLCCRCFAIPSLDKPAGVPCSFLAGPKGPNACTRYETRPLECSSFVCEYIRGFGEEGDRPDLVGVMFRKLADGRVVAFEERPNGFKRLRAETLLASIADPLVLVKFDGTREARKNEGPK